jgi:hypothetical protein
MKILSRVEQGWRAHVGADATVETLHLVKRSQFDRAVEAYAEADTVLIGMPLYADAMPSLVKEYFEQLAQYVGRTGNPRMAFAVQSGFSEGLHSRGLERYFERLAERLGAPYGGTIVRGGGESLRSMPDEASKKLWANLVALGESLARDGRFDPELLASVVGVERFSPLTAAVLGAALKWPLPAIMWPELKKSGAWDRRDAQPYVESAGQRG